MPFVNHRWLGGLLTNWRTISVAAKPMEELRRLRDEGRLKLVPPKEQIAMGQQEKLETKPWRRPRHEEAYLTRSSSST